jgi:ribosome-associated toxin RatA of RatAB toxin-antitoxin module
MRDVTIRAVVGADPDGVFRMLADFPRYVELAPSVRSVTMSADRSRSAWEVTFRDGLLRWTEADWYDPVARRIDFRQVAGDMDRFEGSWAVAEAPGGSAVTFTAVFDLGLPGLTAFLEPVAARALEENITELLQGLFAGTAVEFPEPRPDPDGITGRR